MSSLFNSEEQTFIEGNVKGLSSEQLTNLVNERFNKNITIKQMQQYKKSHKLKSGISTRFTKGQAPYNKLPMFSEFIATDGYTYIKVAENSWKHKQVYIYENIYGKIPKNHSVIFADKNKQNFELDNLILIENKDKLTAKNQHLIFEEKELTKTGLLIAQIINTRKEKICKKK